MTHKADKAAFQLMMAAVIAFLVILFLALLTGCATPQDQFADEFRWTFNGHIFSDDEITIQETIAIVPLCGYAYACAKPDLQNARCTIYISPHATLYEIRHEIRHCKGWTHS